MSRVKVTEELMREIRETVFGPCTVVYEALTWEELRSDLDNYLDQNRVYMRGERRAIYKPSLTLTNFKSWLLFRVEIEVWDANPETPFDRTNTQIERAIKEERELRKRLTTNINKLVDRLREEQNAK